MGPDYPRDLNNQTRISFAVNSAAGLEKRKIDDALIAHKNCVYSDPEFVNLASELKKKMPKTLQNPYGTLKVHVLDSAFAPLSKKQDAAVDILARSFAITRPDVINYLDGLSGANDLLLSNVTFNYTKDMGFYIQILKGATKQEIRGTLKYLDEFMKFCYGETRRKNKPPHYYPLVYAIFRLEAHGEKFKDIFKQYCEENLSNYSGPYGIFATREELSEYYQKYHPMNTGI